MGVGVEGLRGITSEMDYKYSLCLLTLEEERQGVRGGGEGSLLHFTL